MTIYRGLVEQQARRFSTPGRVEIAKAIVADHRGSAPVDSGEYRDGATVTTRGDDVAVFNRDSTSVYKELGTSDTPAHATMINAARKYGRYSGWMPR
ncbi:HK97 gp10 family phage protein [Blastococcus sp. CCUG 61487]|uniref:HK97 gp10 family phage protein n=1 Tax=Blastococcus sp. CCUG 61487 TaxID=1840703 RepID=UPI0010C0FC7D|nr:HK97 gp10 family phage protein [Blastococcus sp. CCUG 61487]TKJ25221.1 hypothetical protein A6V29_04150 [Blastococcus sp. CCUG 61487]